MEGAPQVRLLPSPLSSGSPTCDLHTQPRLYLLPPSRGRGAEFHQLSTSAGRGGFCLCAILSTEGPSGPRLLLPGSSHAQRLSSPCRGLPGPAIATNSTATHVRALTPFHGEKPGARGPGGMSLEDSPPPCLQEPFGFTGDALPPGRVSPHTELGSSWPQTKTIP